MEAVTAAVTAWLPATEWGRAGAVLLGAATVDFAVQWTMFLVSYALRTEKLYDATGTQTFVLLALSNLLQVGEPHPRQVVATAFVVIWALRLSFFLVSRVLAVGEDSRFRHVKGKFGLFLAYWTLQVLGTCGDGRG